MLWVTDMAFVTSFSQNLLVYFNKGPHGTFQFNGRMMQPAVTQVAGQIFYVGDATQFPADQLLFEWPAFNSGYNQPSSPIAVIPPTYSLILQGDSGNDTDNTFGLRWVALPP